VSPLWIFDVESFEAKVEAFAEEAGALLKSPASQRARRGMPGRAFFLDDHHILALTRDNGDSRYPYGHRGFNFWVYASGYMHANEGLFSYLLRANEGREPQVAFFAGFPDGSDRFVPLPLLAVPRVVNPCDSDAVRYAVLTSSAAYFFTEWEHLRFAVRAAATEGKELCFSLLASNLSDRSHEFFLSSFLNPYLRNQIFESEEDRWFRRVSILPPTPGPGNLASFLVRVNEDIDRTRAVSHLGVIRRYLSLSPGASLIRHEETASRHRYVGGQQSSLHTARALLQGTFGRPQAVCTFVETAIAGDLLHLTLERGATARLDIVLTYLRDDESAARRLAAEPLQPGMLDAELAVLEEDDRSRHKGLAVSVGPSADPRLEPLVFNGFLEHLKRQVEFCALLKGYVQLSVNSLIGIRDVFQALEALAFWEPVPTRAKMLEALSFTAPDGRCFRQYSLPFEGGEPGRVDLRPFIDQGVWVISTVATYLRVTGDWEFLEEVCGYHEIVDESAKRVRTAELRDSVLDHLLKIADYLLANRDHEHTGCVRALFGDWNDALDGLGVSKEPGKAYGSGVSVMATLQVYQNCHEMVELLEAVDANRYAKAIARYRRAATDLEKALRDFAIVVNDKGERRLLHGWGDRRSYLVGSFHDPDGKARDGLTTNAFWVLSGMLDRDPSIKPVILAALNRLDSKYGYKTFEPFFAEDVVEVGRIRKLPPGTAENGATYVHATAFAIAALFRMGEPRLAWEQLVKILPFTEIHENLSHSPFVMPNSYGYNPQKFIDGQNMNDWQTGSSNVVLKLLIRYVFGFEPNLKGLWVQPAAWVPFKSFDFNIRVRGCDVHLRFEDQGRSRRTFLVNGAPQQGTRDAMMNIEKLWVPYGLFDRGELEIQVHQ
jgi:hypothetical protein